MPKMNSIAGARSVIKNFPNMVNQEAVLRLSFCP